MASSPPPDPITILLEEHVAGLALFDTFERTLAAAQAAESGAALAAARDLLVYLDGALEVHIRKEEEPLFPRLKARLPADDRYVDELVAEHDQARIRREELRAALDDLLSGGDHAEMRDERERLRAATVAADLAGLRAASRVLLRTLRVHFQNEEELAFPLATDLLSTEELAAAGWEMLAIDEETAHMSSNEPQRTRPEGETTGSAERPAQRLAAPILSFDLTAEVAALKAEAAWGRGDRNAKTLVKEPDFRVLLTAMKEGARLARHLAPGRLTIHVVQGRLRVQVGDAPFELGAGGLVALERELPHDVTALEESAFLLTIAWPSGPSAIE